MEITGVIMLSMLQRVAPLTIPWKLSYLQYNEKILIAVLLFLLERMMSVIW